ncbi:MAG TPA: L-glutamate gamma-semialdehyde dehydrogenase [Rectinemataceae bacterium]|nr:L-glutamate gamma-semialdehyde dehydrogenase [Rectinemataceae bacterium]
MNDSRGGMPPAQNEPVASYAPGTAGRAALKKALDEVLAQPVEIGPIIGGREIRTGRTLEMRRPDDHGHVLGLCHLGGGAEAAAAIEASLAARREWAATPWEERAAVFRRAAELIAGKYRYRLLAATMLGQSKTPHQAEIDAVCESADFLRFNPVFMEGIYAEQPLSTQDEWNRLSYRPLEGFVFAVSPFNFTSIAANLPTAPAMMGNVVVWKPASTALYSNWLLMKVYEEAGLPPGVINFLPGGGSAISGTVFSHRDFAGLHFTGSTGVFNSLWKLAADNLGSYRSYPRIVGETGGKDFIFLDPSADKNVAITAIIRGAYEYQGQKCSAASRLYIPASLGRDFVDELVAEIRSIPMGKTDDFSNFFGAVIDEAAFDGMKPWIDRAASSREARVIAGGVCDKSRGYFIEPTLIETTNPRYETMETELFGPILTSYIYDDRDMEAAYRLVDGTSPYALTGAVIARDRLAVVRALAAFRGSAGNLYVNDKPTGAVVGRQPFGGARGSGTNDKAGSPLNLLRWVSAQAIKENFNPPEAWTYPFMAKDEGSPASLR